MARLAARSTRGRTVQGVAWVLTQLNAVLVAVEMAVLILGLAYFLALLAAGWRVAGWRVGPRWAAGEQPREEQVTPDGPAGTVAMTGGAGDGEPATEADGSPLVVFLIPCLNEEAVIGATVTSLLSQPGQLRILVIDDGSEDATAAIVSDLAARDDRVLLLRRVAPNARQGKGAALNHAFAQVSDLVTASGWDPARVLIGVMDADGRMSDRIVETVAPLFDDPTVGGAQLAVKIRNRGQFLTNIQDFEFWGATALAQFGRVMSGSVSLGGNGQFTRLEALLGLDREPWTPTALTEDLDLAVTLATRGWSFVSTPDAWVSQQGVTSLRAVLRQRTRWYQGHMVCAGRVGELWRAPELSGAAVLEMSMYLLSPFLLALPWSVLFHLELFRLVTSEWVSFSRHDPNAVPVAIVRLVTWYVLGFTPAWLAGWIYAKRQDHTSFWRSVGYAHVAAGTTYITWAAAWRALFRMLSKRGDWKKTARAAEAGDPLAVPLAP